MTPTAPADADRRLGRWQRAAWLHPTTLLAVLLCAALALAAWAAVNRPVEVPDFHDREGGAEFGRVWQRSSRHVPARAGPGGRQHPQPGENCTRRPAAGRRHDRSDSHLHCRRRDGRSCRRLAAVT